MNNQQLYLAWLRTYSPTTYATAIRKATGQNRSTGGLTDDLLGKALSPDLSHSFLGDDTGLDEIQVTAQYASDPVTFDSSQIDFQTPSFDSGSVEAPGALSFQSAGPTTGSGSATGLPSSSSGSSAGSIFSNVLTAVTAIGAGVLNYSNQSNLIKLNTTRAQQGLPPVNAAGQVVSPYSTATTSPGLLAFEQAISGGSSTSMLMIIAVLGIGAFLLLKSPSKAA